MCQCEKFFYVFCGHIKEQKCTAPSPAAKANGATNGTNGVPVNGINGTHGGANGVFVNGRNVFGAVGDPRPKKEGAGGHVGRPMTPDKLAFVCSGLPEEALVVNDACPGCFFR